MRFVSEMVEKRRENAEGQVCIEIPDVSLEYQTPNQCPPIVAWPFE